MFVCMCTEASDGHSNSYFQFQLSEIMWSLNVCPWFP